MWQAPISGCVLLVGTICRAAHPLAADIHWLLEESGRSMREMATETREQQREWWHARLGLDDQLAALLQAMDSSWLGCWR